MIVRFWDWVDSRAVIRRFVLFFTLYMTWQVTVSAWSFAALSRYDGLGTAAVIAAVTAPFTALMKFVFDTYTAGRKD